MNHPIISVIMPVFNAENYLKEAIDSILNQTYSNFEFIIINDGSIDKTEDIILSYTDSRIVYVKNEVNLKLIKTLNKGIDLAKGKYIARMDADDISLPERLAKQLNVFENYSGIDIVNARAYKMLEDGSILHPLYFNVGFEAIRFISIFKSMIVHSGVMVKSNLMKLHKYHEGYEVEHIEDMDLWNRLFLAGSICYTIEEPLLNYRITSTGISATQIHAQTKRQNKMTMSILKENFSFEIEENLLLLMWGINTYGNKNMIPKLELSLSKFISIILSKNVISKEGIKDLDFWKKYTIFKSSFMIIKQINFVQKVNILFYIITKIRWINVSSYLIKFLVKPNIKNS